MAQVKRKNKAKKTMQEIEGDALGCYLLFLKANVNCTSDILPLENTSMRGCTCSLLYPLCLQQFWQIGRA